MIWTAIIMAIIMVGCATNHLYINKAGISEQ